MSDMPIFDAITQLWLTFRRVEIDDNEEPTIIVVSRAVLFALAGECTISLRDMGQTTLREAAEHGWLIIMGIVVMEHQLAARRDPKVAAAIKKALGGAGLERAS